MADLRSNPLFADIVFKIDESDGHAFKKIFVRYRAELVTLRYNKKLDPNTDGGGRLKPKQFMNFCSATMSSSWTGAPAMNTISDISSAPFVPRLIPSGSFQSG